MKHHNFEEFLLEEFGVHLQFSSGKKRTPKNNQLPNL